MSQTKNISHGLFWKLLERFGVTGTQFVLQIILARLLDPEHYGVLSLMIIFTTLANVFIQSGLNTALIQNKDITEDDYSSVFWVSFGIAGILYATIFFASPLIAEFYEMPSITQPLRVLALMLFPGALNSVQLAKITKAMDFRKVFISNLVAIVVSGTIGIVMAYMGMGLWALVGQSLANVFVSCIVMFFTAKLRLHLRCNINRVGVLFKFGWKLLVSALIDTLYTDIYGLIVGKKYDSATLGYYNKGKQFPQFIISAINGAVQSVMLPAMSSRQDDVKEAKHLMRTSMTLSSYIIFPMMAGLAAVATPLVQLLLTDKWLPCVPYLQIFCFSLAFLPVHSCNLQTINAMGRSDLFLVLEIIKKGYGALLLVIAIVFFDSPIYIAATGIISTIVSSFVNAFPNKKLIGYSYFEQMRDILPSFLISISMFALVWWIGSLITLHPILVILIQVATGIVFYVATSAIFRVKPFMSIISLVKNKLHLNRS